MQVGLFFGSFNPIHMGHLMLAQALANTKQVDVVWFVVSPQNPHKDKATLAPQHDRLRMVELAVDGNPSLLPSNVEFLLPQPSYTVDTLTHLATRYPKYRFHLLMGEDNLRSLPRWKTPDLIIGHYPIHVYPRLTLAGETSLSEPLPTDNIHRLEAPFIQLSASQIRQMLAAGHDCRYLLPGPVLQYIRQHHLYDVAA